MHQRLKTRLLLSTRGLNIDLSCPLCTNAVENCEHLFFACKYTNEVWRVVLADFGIARNPTTWNVELRWLRQVCKGRNAKAKLIRVLFSCPDYMLWSERNKQVFYQGSSTSQEISSSITSIVRMIL